MPWESFRAEGIAIAKDLAHRQILCGRQSPAESRTWRDRLTGGAKSFAVSAVGEVPARELPTGAPLRCVGYSLKADPFHRQLTSRSRIPFT
jgi:hypothetical protein